MVIGGEHYFAPSHLFKKSTGYIDKLLHEFKARYNVSYTFGGYFSLLAIIEDIKPKLNDDSVVLLPSYICPDILKPFKLKGVKIDFYKVDENLFVDNEYIKSILNINVKAILFIDYFGASQLDRMTSLIELLKSKEIIIIQDVVQNLQLNMDQFFGEYIFNSFRKFFPFEGSLLLSKEKMNITYGKLNTNYLITKRIGQCIRYLHVKYNIFPSKSFLSFLDKAEDNYYSKDVLGMPKFNKKQLNKYKIDSIINQQNYYYNQLVNNYKVNIPGLLSQNAFTPFGLVLRIDNRDMIRRKLFDQNIFPPIHWMLPKAIDNNMYQKSIELSSCILTLPLVDLNDQKFQYLIAQDILFPNGTYLENS